jgi:Meiotically up-regulated gene 113
MDKQHILREIHRTAKANGGVPLGSEKFLQETGIKLSDWSGIHWARWGDALREAGFTANEFQRAHDEDHLLEKYVTLIREGGRIPVMAELRLKRRSDQSFPSHNTFARFGTKQQLIAKVIEFCRSRGGLEDVEQICQAQIAAPKTDPNEDHESVDDEFGFVYLIQSDRFFKIGKTNALGRREYELKIQLPEKAKTVHFIRTDDPTGIEAYWHKRFETRRKNGEWFELSRADVVAFKRRKFM